MMTTVEPTDSKFPSLAILDNQELTSLELLEKMFEVMDTDIRPLAEEMDAKFDWHPGKRGRKPHPRMALFRLVLFMKLNGNISYRHATQRVNADQAFRELLGFERPISRGALSHFMDELTPERIDDFFRCVVEGSRVRGLIGYGRFIVDSAPVIAWMNPRWNGRVGKVDHGIIAAFFGKIGLYLETLPLPSVRKRKYSLCSKIKVILLGKLGAFYGRKGTIKYLEKHADCREAVLGRESVPPEYSFPGDMKKYSAWFDLQRHFEAVVCALTGMPGMDQNRIRNAKTVDDLQGILARIRGPIDPEARLGYCAAKRSSFYGYRLHASVDDLYTLPVSLELVPADANDGQTLDAWFPKLLKDAGGIPDSLVADAGYKTDDCDAHLERNSIENNIIPRDYRDDDIPSIVKKRNRAWINRRVPVEGFFGNAQLMLQFENPRVRRTWPVYRWMILAFSLYHFAAWTAHALKQWDLVASLSRFRV
jgi:hypothetical protein